MKRKIFIMTVLAVLTLQMSVFADCKGYVLLQANVINNTDMPNVETQNNDLNIPIPTDPEKLAKLVRQLQIIEEAKKAKAEYELQVDQRLRKEMEPKVLARIQAGNPYTEEEYNYELNINKQYYNRQFKGTKDANKNCLPYLLPGESYTFTDNGPLEAPTNGQKEVVYDPIHNDNWLYSSVSGEWISDNKAKAQRAASIEKERKQFEGTRKLTDEESRRLAEMFARGMRGD